jgi:hypothetical protein
MDFTHRTSTADLYDLADKIGLKNLIITSKSGFAQAERQYESIVMNLNDTVGSHWTAVNTKKKLYFDSYNQPPPECIPRSYKSANHDFEVQSIDAQDCGQLSVLFLYYCKYKSVREFYRLFKDVY